MIVVMKTRASKEDVEKVVEIIEEHDFSAHVSRGKEKTVIGVVGDNPQVLNESLGALPGIDKVIRISEPYRLASRDFQPEPTIISTGKLEIGGDELTIIAGPCAIESEEQFFETVKQVKIAGADLVRAGAFKPRTSPYSFSGLRQEGLKLAAEARARFGLPMVGEVLNATDLEEAAEYLDIIQIGSRNMQNFGLLQEAGKLDKPVLLKRGFTATYREFLLAAEYIMVEGNHRVILCERGIRTFVEHTRNTLDIACVAVIKELSHLPIIVDPSHGTGRNTLVTPLARAATAAGADGLIVEVHPNPEKALCDGQQSLTPAEFTELVKQTKAIREASQPKLELI